MRWSVLALAVAALLCFSLSQPQEASAAVPTAPLAGRVVAVDAGHGLPDCGCTGRTKGAQEHVLNLDIARRVAYLLQGAGASVVMVREDDYALHPRDMPIGNRKKTDFALRADKVLAENAELVLSIHMNEYPSAKSSGSQVFYEDGDEDGRRLALAIQASLLRDQPGNRRGASSGDFFMLRIGPPGVLVECGFLSNPAEEALLLTPAYREKIATRIVQGVCAYLDEETQNRP